MKIPHAVKQLSQWATTEPALWSPQAVATEGWVPRACASRQEKPLQYEAWAMKSSPCSPRLEKAQEQPQRSGTTKGEKKKYCFANAGGTGLIPSWGTKIPHAMWIGKKRLKKKKKELEMASLVVQW